MFPRYKSPCMGCLSHSTSDCHPFPQRMCITSGLTTFSNIAHIVILCMIFTSQITVVKACRSLLGLPTAYLAIVRGYKRTYTIAWTLKQINIFFRAMGLVNKWVCFKNEVTRFISCKNTCSRIQKLLLCNYPAINSQTHTSHLVAYISAMSQ